MNKSELIGAMAIETSSSKAETTVALDAIITSITKALKNGDKIAITGFGTFSTKDRAARNGRNPSTGKAIKIKAKTVVKWKPSKDLI